MGQFYARFSFWQLARRPSPSGMGKELRQFALLRRSFPQPELDGNIIKPAGPEAAIEVTQPGNDHAHNRHLDIGPRLIEHEEIEPRAPGDIDAGIYLPACVVQKAESRRRHRLIRWVAAGR